LQNLNEKLLNRLKNFNNIKPNHCQIEATKIISKELNRYNKFTIVRFFSNIRNIYLYGSFGVGKSVLIKALNYIYPNSVIFHFSDLIFFLQKNHTKEIELLKKFGDCKVILVDEFFINNLANLLIFEKFFHFAKKKNILLILTSNKHLRNIYNDPVNPNLSKKIISLFIRNFETYNMRSKIDYRTAKSKNDNFFFEGLQEKIKRKQNNLIKKYAITSIPREVNFKRSGNKFILNNYYGNMIDLDFSLFFNKDLVFKDYEMISKKVKIFILRNLSKKGTKNEKFMARFIFFIDVLYENKNILSLSSEMELDKIKANNINSFDFKRTVSRLKEMRSGEYIKDNLKLVFKR
jgi:cell division protein ZapE